MKPSQAVQKAKEFVLELFKDEPIARVGLEELVFKDAEALWEVTIGFQRVWESDSPNLRGLLREPRRTYKTVSMRDDGSAISLTHRDVAYPA